MDVFSISGRHSYKKKEFDSYKPIYVYSLFIYIFPRFYLIIRLLETKETKVFLESR